MKVVRGVFEGKKVIKFGVNVGSVTLKGSARDAKPRITAGTRSDPPGEPLQ